MRQNLWGITPFGRYRPTDHSATRVGSLVFLSQPGLGWLSNLVLRDFPSEFALGRYGDSEAGFSWCR